MTFRSIPWRSVFTSRNVWIVNIVGLCFGTGYVMAQKMLPQFMEDVLKLSISEVQICHGFVQQICNVFL